MRRINLIKQVFHGRHMKILTMVHTQRTMAKNTPRHRFSFQKKGMSNICMTYTCSSQNSLFPSRFPTTVWPYPQLWLNIIKFVGNWHMPLILPNLFNILSSSSCTHDVNLSRQNGTPHLSSSFMIHHVELSNSAKMCCVELSMSKKQLSSDRFCRIEQLSSDIMSRIEQLSWNILSRTEQLRSDILCRIEHLSSNILCRMNEWMGFNGTATPNVSYCANIGTNLKCQIWK